MPKRQSWHGRLLSTETFGDQHCSPLPWPSSHDAPRRLKGQFWVFFKLNKNPRGSFSSPGLQVKADNDPNHHPKPNHEDAAVAGRRRGDATQRQTESDGFPPAIAQTATIKNHLETPSQRERRVNPRAPTLIRVQRCHQPAGS